jgi:cytidylate kinase
MFRVVTIAREYGSGGAEIGRRVAEKLGWELVDRQIIERAANLCQVDRRWAEQADEQCCGWWERVLSGFCNGGPEAYLGDGSDLAVDRDSLQRFTARVIAEAGKAGRCVIVGRGSSCVLRHQPDVLRVLVYAPEAERLERLRQRLPNHKDLPALLRARDAERIHYVQEYYGCDAHNHSLYQLSLNSTLGLDLCARLIVEAVNAPAPL